MKCHQLDNTVLQTIKEALIMLEKIDSSYFIKTTHKLTDIST